MSEYCPDKWVVIEIKQQNNPPLKKVLAGWYGGYLNGDSWRMSSGITKIIDNEDHYIIENESGSVYTCYKDRRGFNDMSGSIYSHMLKQLEDRNDVSVELMETV